MEEIKENWIDKMIAREALPLHLREETVADFCKKYGIVDSNYYYHSSKPENKEKIVGIALNNVKKYAPEVLENLGERAKSNSKDAEMYLKFILQLAERKDLFVKEVPQPIIDILNVHTNNSNKENNSPEEEN